MRCTGRWVVAMSMLVVGLGPGRSAPGAVEIVATSRMTSATAFCSGEFCRGSDSASATTTDIGFWNDGAGAAVPVATGGGQQDSFVFPTSMGGFGEAAGSGGGASGHWTGATTLETTFVLDGPTDYSCVGGIAANGFGSNPGAVTCAALAKLVGPGGDVFEFAVMGDGFGGQTAPIAQVGSLAAGIYVFSVSATASGFASELSFGDGSSSFDLTLSLCPSADGCRADLDGNGVVDGADLGRLLGGWGDGGSMGDLDCDGVVTGEDLGILVAAWGPCG